MNKMTKIAILFVALAVTFSFSQENSLKLGARAGLNLVDIRFPERPFDYDVNTGFGFGAGLVVSIPFTTKLSLNPELAFYYREIFSCNSTYGFSIEEIGPQEKEANMTELAISIPVLLHFAPFENVPLYLEAGVQLDIPISPEIKSKDTYKDTIVEMTYDFLTNHRTIDFGIVLGVGGMVTSNLGIDFRYVMGMTGLFEDFTERYYYHGKDGDYEKDSFEDKSSLTQFGIGITYFF
jgi:hypothetical protein